MSGNHAWRSSGDLFAARYGLVVFVAGVLSTAPVAATQRQALIEPVILAQAEIEPLPAITADRSLVNISPEQEPAPDIFDGKGQALWDGRGTLRGVWVAHPMAKTARRVRIYNLENGAVVDGAMFKHDLSVDDARLIVSSDAASKLGLEPKSPAQLRIVAVRPASEPAPADETKAAEAGTKEKVTGDEGKPASGASPAVTPADDGDAAAGPDGEMRAEDASTPAAEKPTGDAANTSTGTETTTAEAKPPLRKAGAPPVPRRRPAKTEMAAAAASPADTSTGGYDPMAAARTAIGFKFVPDTDAESKITAVNGYFRKDAALTTGPEAALGVGEITLAAPQSGITATDRQNGQEPRRSKTTEPREKQIAGDPGSSDRATEMGSAPVWLPEDPGTPLARKRADPVAERTLPATVLEIITAAATDPPKEEATPVAVEKPADPTVTATPVIADGPAGRTEKTAPGASDGRTAKDGDAEMRLAAVAKAPAEAAGSVKPSPSAGSSTPSRSESKPPAKSSPLALPYVQVGLFGIPENAAKLAEKLRAKGIPAILRPVSAGGKEFNRVLVGPFKDTATRDRVQTMVRDLGLTDAMPVKG